MNRISDPRDPEQSVYTQKLEDQAQQAALTELYGLGYDFAEKYVQKIDAVTVADVRRVAEAYLNHPLLLTLGPPPPKAPGDKAGPGGEKPAKKEEGEEKGKGNGKGNGKGKQ